MHCTVKIKSKLLSTKALFIRLWANELKFKDEKESRRRKMKTKEYIKRPKESNTNERNQRTRMRSEKKIHTHIFTLMHTYKHTNTCTHEQTYHHRQSKSSSGGKTKLGNGRNWRKMGIKLFYDFVREQHIAILWTHLWLWKQDGNGLRGSGKKKTNQINLNKNQRNGKHRRDGARETKYICVCVCINVYWERTREGVG